MTLMISVDNLSKGRVQQNFFKKVIIITFGGAFVVWAESIDCTKRNGSISTTDTSDFYYLNTNLSAVLNNVNVSI